MVLMTRGHAHDHTILEQIYYCPARYLGMLGSKPRIAKIWQHLEAKGIAREWLERAHAPIGVNIHARSPEEIGISILAELIHVRRTSPVVSPSGRPSAPRAVLTPSRFHLDRLTHLHGSKLLLTLPSCLG